MAAYTRDKGSRRVPGSPPHRIAGPLATNGCTMTTLIARLAP